MKTIQDIILTKKYDRNEQREKKRDFSVDLELLLFRKEKKKIF